MADRSNPQSSMNAAADQLSRREFARRAALAATAAVVTPVLVEGQESSASKPTATGDKPAPASAGLSPQLQQEGELKFQWIMQRYGDRLSAAEKEDIHRLVMEGQKPLTPLYAFPIDNGDDPALVLKFTDTEAGSGGGRP